MDKKKRLLELLKKRKEELTQQKVNKRLEDLMTTLLDEDFSIQGPAGEKGLKGDKGDKGDSGKNGKDGNDGKSGEDGLDGLSGKDGTNGRDGRDGSPDNAFDVRNKLELLNGDERLKIESIRGAKELRDELLEMMNRGLMSLDNNRVLGIKVKGGAANFANEITFIGATVTPNHEQGVDVTINELSGGIPIFSEIVAGSIDTFTLAFVPIGNILLILNGQVATLTNDYTINGKIITTVLSWSAGQVQASYSH